MNDRRYVYVAGPYSKPGGCQELNAKKMVIVADLLLNVGYYPYCTLLTHWWNELCPRSWDSWMKYDRAWLPKCYGLLRLPGESEGCDIEVSCARGIGMQVVIASSYEDAALEYMREVPIEV